MPSMRSEKPMTAIKASAASVPTKIKGRRRPKREVLRSERMPISACTSSAVISVQRRVVP